MSGAYSRKASMSMPSNSTCFDLQTLDTIACNSRNECDVSIVQGWLTSVFVQSEQLRLEWAP